MPPAGRPFMSLGVAAFLLAASTAVHAQPPFGAAHEHLEALNIAGPLVTAQRGLLQEPGQLRIIMQLTDSRAGVTYPAAKKALTITGEAGAPVFHVETGRDGRVEISMPPGVYFVQSADPVPFQRRTYRWNTNVVVDAGAMIVLELNERNAQSTPVASAERGPFVAPFVQYGAPQRLTGGLSVLIPVGATVREEGVLLARGLALEASGGQGGWRVGAGVGAAGFPFWWSDVLLTATRTTARPRGAVPESTYVGVEVGAALLLPLDEWVYLPFGIMIKPSFGFARTLDAPEGDKRTTFTWSAGAQVLAFKF